MAPAICNERLIREVFARPCLWQVKSKDYKDTNKKKLLWVEIAELMLPGDPTDVSLILVQRRWKSLRDRFTRYVAELAKQQKSGAGAEDTIPDVTLPYFEQMLFLKDTVAHRQTSGNMVVPVVDEGRGTQQDCAEDLLERIADLYEAPDPRGCVDAVLVEDVQCADSPACTSSAANGTSSECVEVPASPSTAPNPRKRAASFCEQTGGSLKLERTRHGPVPRAKSCNWSKDCKLYRTH
ncbi:uncharacterized protein ISCGN_029668 [Ixodes scapularis]